MSKLIFTPYVWSKLRFMRDRGDTEVSGVGYSHPSVPGLVTEFNMVKQYNTGASTEFDDDEWAEWGVQQDQLGRTPEETQSIWIHTHPDNSATPSSWDEKTAVKIFGKCGWWVMYILAKGGHQTCRLTHNGDARQSPWLPHLFGADKKLGCQLTPDGDILLPTMSLEVKIDHDGCYEGVTQEDREAWEEEYVRCVRKKLAPVQAWRGKHQAKPYSGQGSRRKRIGHDHLPSYYDYDDYDHGDDYYHRAKRWPESEDHDLARPVRRMSEEEESYLEAAKRCLGCEEPCCQLEKDEDGSVWCNDYNCEHSALVYDQDELIQLAVELEREEKEQAVWEKVAEDTDCEEEVDDWGKVRRLIDEDDDSVLELSEEKAN